MKIIGIVFPFGLDSKTLPTGGFLRVNFSYLILSFKSLLKTSLIYEQPLQDSTEVVEEVDKATDVTSSSCLSLFL